jgi:hypothetical protein
MAPPDYLLAGYGLSVLVAIDCTRMKLEREEARACRVYVKILAFRERADRCGTRKEGLAWLEVEFGQEHLDKLGGEALAVFDPAMQRIGLIGLKTHKAAAKSIGFAKQIGVFLFKGDALRFRSNPVMRKSQVQ